MHLLEGYIYYNLQFMFMNLWSSYEVYIHLLYLFNNLFMIFIIFIYIHLFMYLFIYLFIHLFIRSYDHGQKFVTFFFSKNKHFF